MKLKGNGGYQIIDFEGQAPNTLDVDFFSNAIARGKPLWVNNLVVDGKTYSGVASAKITALAIVLTLATLTITIALEDGATTYEESGDFDLILEDIELDASLEYTGTDDRFQELAQKLLANPQPIKAKMTMIDQNNDKYHFIGYFNIDDVSVNSISITNLLYDNINDSLSYIRITISDTTSNNIYLYISSVNA